MQRPGEFAAKMKWELLADPVEMKPGFGPDSADKCRALARDIAQKSAR